MTPFLDKAKKDHNGKYMEPMQLLAQYIDHLGQYDRRFVGIDHSTLITTYKGVYDIYDLLRKRVQRLEEKNMPRSARQLKEKPTLRGTYARGDASRAKTATPGAPDPEPNQIQEKPHTAAKATPPGKPNPPMDFVQITADDRHNFHMEEKPVKYAKNMDKDSSSGLTEHEAPDYHSDDEEGEAEQDELDTENFAEVKEKFNDLLDLHEEDEITYVWFDYDFATGICRKTVHTKRVDTNE